MSVINSCHRICWHLIKLSVIFVQIATTSYQTEEVCISFFSFQIVLALYKFISIFIEFSEKCKHLREIHKLTKSLKLSSKLHNCRICQENFSTSYLLSEHLVTKHPEDTDLVTSCPKSGCKFKCPKGSIRLRSHLQKFHNNEFADKIYKFECRICYGRFKSGDILKTHIMTKHDESHGRVKCPYCPYALPTKRKSDLYR